MSTLAPAALLAFSGLALAGPSATQDLYVTSRFTDEVLRFELDTGALVESFASGGGLDNPVGLTFGPDGHLYVASAASDEVLRFDGESGAFMDAFATGGGLDDPRQVNFGPDGMLYVSNARTNEILRFDGRTGDPMGPFATGGGLRGPTSFVFGPRPTVAGAPPVKRRADIFVVSVLNDRIKRFDGRSGAYLGDFVATNLRGPHDLAFGPDGRLYVSNAFSRAIQVFDPSTGDFIESFINDPALRAPLGIGWDGRGHFLVANQGRDQVRRYDAQTGEFVDVLVASGLGGLASPLFFALGPDRDGLRLHDLRPGRAGRTNRLTVSGAPPGALVQLLVSVDSRRRSIDGCSSPLLLLSPAAVRIPMVADESGRGFVQARIPISLAGVELAMQALLPTNCVASRILTLRLR